MMRLVLAVLATLMLSCAARAQSPSFQGHWRIVAAEPAVWSRERATPAPLMNKRVIFKEGALDLLPGVLCQKPEVEENWIPSRWLLGGEMSGKALSAFYERHRITPDANLKALTLICGDREMQFVLAAEGRALAAHEGWVYTLRRRATQ